MQLQQFFVLAAAVLPVAMAASLPQSYLSCDDPKHPCKTYSSFPDCPDDYIETLEQCQSTGCIKWVMDPLEHCQCNSSMHACKTYTNYKDCSPQYIADLKECVYTGCLQWVQDPLKHCNTSTYY